MYVKGILAPGGVILRLWGFRSVLARLLTEEFVNPHMVDLPGNGFISDLERFYLQKRFYHGLICHFPSDDGKCKKRKDKEGHQKGLFRFFMKTFLGSQPHHPDHQVVCQDAALENGGIGPEDAGADGAGGHLALAPGDPVFTGGSLTIQLMNMPRSMGRFVT